MTSTILTTILFLGLRNAVTYGYLPLSTTTIRHDTSAAARAALGWAIVFMIFLLAGVLAMTVLGPFMFVHFNRIEHLLLLFLGFISLINLSEKREPFNRFIRDRRWLYAVGMLQGLSALEIIPTIYALSNEITFAVSIISAVGYGLCFTILVSGIAIVIALLGKTGPKIRKILIVIISLLCIINGAINFFLNI